jgi:predicted RecA/RadA family phage recombinase
LFVKNFVQQGDTVPLVMTAAVVSGQLVQIGKFVGVAAVNGAIGDTVEVRIVGVFSLSKTPADVITQGQALKMIPASGVVDASGTVTFGVAAAAAGAGTTTVLARLMPSAA